MKESLEELAKQAKAELDLRKLIVKQSDEIQKNTIQKYKKMARQMGLKNEKATVRAALRIAKISMDEVISDNREQMLSRKRFLFWSVLYNGYGWGLSKIARLSHRHHASILHGIKQLKKLEGK